MIVHYFAYGSNMNPARVAERGLATHGHVGAVLTDYNLLFDKVSRDHLDIGHANIAYAPGERVEGLLYELASPSEILKMDPFERAPINYGREVVRVATATSELWAWTYFANDAVRQAGRRPSQEYLGHLLAGEAFLSEEYFARLAETPVAD